MIHMNKYILIVVFISSLISAGKVKAAEIIPDGEQNDYVVKFGDSYHNYIKGNHVRIDVSFKNLLDKMAEVTQELIVVNANNERVWDTRINLQLQPKQYFTVPFMVPVPQISGNYNLTIPKASGTSAVHLPLF